MISASVITSFLVRLTSALSKGILLVLVIPLAVAILFTYDVMSTLTLIGTTLLIEYGAAPVGVLLGLPPVFIFFVLSCVALGVMIALYDIFDSISEHSERVQNFLDRSKRRAEKSKILSRYGIYGLVIVALTIGFYLCPPISWVCGWDRKTSIICTMAGYCIVTIALIIAAPFVLVYMPWVVPV
ncbi:MAG: hypothetical protein CVV32_12770 [Methanomicrobiales archaeon HGW-Methanomicrobiales-3]|jgi:hypothetical protein|nr:MAG: hypothetical protein CVV32_12770 [Methanomicrobiales archaeon HGW-Methanomicrobiales-3]